jgi:isoleucyl-tRNA synthetase
VTLEDYYLDIIREELNLKTLSIDPSISQLVTMIVKPNARMLGKRLGGAMQDVIREAKAGNYTKLEGGQIQVGDYTISSDEYEVEYQSADVSQDVAVDRDTVLLLDTAITPELKLE